MGTLRFKRRKATPVAPVEVGVEVGGGVRAGLTLVAGQVCGDGQTEDLIVAVAESGKQVDSVHPSRSPPWPGGVNAPAACVRPHDQRLEADGFVGASLSPCDAARPLIAVLGCLGYYWAGTACGLRSA